MRYRKFLSRVLPYINKLRFFLFQFRVDSSGERCSFGKNVQFLGSTTVQLGNRVTLRDNVMLGGGGDISIGSNSVINNGSSITACDSVRVGENVMFAPNVAVLDVDHDFSDPAMPVSKQGYLIAPVIIDDGVWLGTGVVVTRGVRIGKNAVVGANSVVTKDIPDFSIAAGIPAKVIKQRKVLQNV